MQSQTEAIENAPCKKCGATDKPLHTNYTCPDCYAEPVSAPFMPGDVVIASTGEPRPPERFNKKLATWKCNNYTGVIIEPADSDGYVTLKQDDCPDIPGCISFWHVVHRRHLQHLQDETQRRYER